MAAAQLDCESALYHVPDLARAQRIQQQAAELMAQNDAALRKDYYRILGLDRGRVSDAEIYRAYKESFLKYSSDKESNPDRSRLMLKDVHAVPHYFSEMINFKAYETLKDPERRKEYDSGFEKARSHSFNIVVTA